MRRYIFVILMLKKAYPIGKADFPKKNKRRCNDVFCFEMEAIVHRILCLEKSVKVGKSSFIQKNRHLDPSFSTVFVGLKIVPQLYLLFFFFWLTRFVFSDVLNLFHIVIHRNFAFWISNWCHFCDILIQFVSYWGPMEATISTRILSSELSGTHNQRALSLKYKESCIHHVQT